MDDNGRVDPSHYRQRDLPETHRYGKVRSGELSSLATCTDSRETTDSFFANKARAIGKITTDSAMTCQNSPLNKKKVQVSIDPAAFAKGNGGHTPLCKRRLDGAAVLLREKNSGSFPNTPQVLRRMEIVQSAMSASSSPVVSRRSELMSEGVMVHRSPVLSRRSEILFSGESAPASGCSSVSNSPIVGRRFESGFGSPARSIGEPGVFASPVHFSGAGGSIRGWREEQEEEVRQGEAPPDQTLVAGWLKFRDNKRVCYSFRYFIMLTKSPISDIVLIQLVRKCHYSFQIVS